MSRLAEHLSPLEQAQVINRFAERLIVTDAIQEANRLLKAKGDHLKIHRDGMETFLQLSAPHLWQAFKLKRGPPSIEIRMRNSKRYIEKLLGLKPEAKKNIAHPPFPIFGDYDEPPKKRVLTFGRGEILERNITPVDSSYHNKYADEAFLRELLPDYEAHQKRDAELRRKKRLEQEVEAHEQK